MSIDNFIDIEDLNIKDMVVESPRNKPPKAEWEVDFPPERFEKAEESLSSSYKDRNWRRFLDIAGPLAILHPEKNPRSYIKDDDYKTITGKLRAKTAAQDDEFDLLCLSEATNLKILFPEKDVIADIGLTEQDIQNIMNYATLSFNSSQQIAEGAINLSLLFPGHMDKWKKQTYKEMFEQSSDFAGLSNGLSGMTVLKIYFPEVERDMPDTYFSDATERILNRSMFYEDDFQYAFYLKLLAAEKIDMTDQGLKLTMPSSDFSPDANPKMPEVRKF